MLLFLLLYIAALVLAGVAAFEARRGPIMLTALAIACVALVGVLQTFPHV